VVLGASLIQGTTGEKLFDPDLAPPADDVARHLFGLVTGTTGDDDGLLFQAYSPMGYATLAAGLATGVAVAVPGALESQRKTAFEQCQLNLKRIGIELTLYAADHEGRFPQSLEELRDLVAARTAESDLPPDGQWFRCPARPLAAGIGYEYVPGLTLDSPPQTIICYDREGNHHKERNVLFVDGRVRSFRENVFQQLLRNQPPGPDDTEPAP
jgi:prepilin-type processing-associated H-X9-DG protein